MINKHFIALDDDQTQVAMLRSFANENFTMLNKNKFVAFMLVRGQEAFPCTTPVLSSKSLQFYLLDKMVVLV